MRLVAVAVIVVRFAAVLGWIAVRSFVVAAWRELRLIRAKARNPIELAAPDGDTARRNVYVSSSQDVRRPAPAAPGEGFSNE